MIYLPARFAIFAIFLIATLASFTAQAAPENPPLADSPKLDHSPFYAMDTAFHRPGLSNAEQLDLVRQLGFDGVAWTEEPAEKLTQSLADIERRHLKMFALYCAAKVTPEGNLSTPPALPELMKVLKGHQTILWIHIGGQGPAIESLHRDSPVVNQLRALADAAAANDLRIAIYPHLGEWTAHFGDAIRLAELVDHKAFGVTFNLCHCLATGDGDKIPALLDAAGARLFTVTLSGADKDITGGQWQKLIQPLGRGSFDVAAVVGKLRHTGFVGPVGFQGYGIKGDARSILEPTMTAWHQMTTAKP